MLVRERLVKDKKEAREAAKAAKAMAAKRITFTDVGKAFIDEHVDTFIGASPIARKQLIHDILSAAADHAELGSAKWTAATVMSRLRNTRNARKRAS